jgi:presenilin-like A22 family membrane protease
MKTYAQIALMFALTQLLGIYAGVVLINAAVFNSEIMELSVAPMPEANDPLNAVVFLVYILAGAAMILVASKLFKGMLFYQLLEFMVVFSSSTILFFALGLSLLGQGFENAVLFGTVAGALLAGAKFVTAKAKNAAAVISSAGVAALFGFSLGFVPTAIFVILLSIYDYIAVFKTRHMITMAKELSTRQLSFSVTAKDMPARMPKEKAEAYVDRAMKEGERLDLGTGDLSVPAMMSVSAFTIGPNGWIYAFAVAAGSTIALYVLLKFVARQRVFLPALPPICLGGMLALLIVKLIGL